MQRASLVCLLAGLWPLAADDVFLREVRPLLQEHCFGCHSGASAQGKLDLSTPAGLQGSVKAGKPDDSPLYQAVAHTGRVRMPFGKPQLPAAAIEKIAGWIRGGAEVGPARHWAFVPPVQPAMPGAGNPIDVFLAAEHKRRGLAAAEPADKRTLLRRVTLDLTGVPPTPDEMRTFLTDSAPNAYERVVDRLLDSGRYGERWGRHWMDIWRYSDWYGYRSSNEVRNSQRHIWQWRDWIVESLNEDRPYDRMIMEMLAGDEIAPTDPKVLRATGYLVRNYKRYDRDGWLQDVVDHTSMAFLGLTLKCARCHDHKYDPLSQREYYQFRAFFEPYQVRLDRVPGETNLEKAGLARVYDAKAETPTYLFVGGDVQNPDKSLGLTPAIPAVLGKVGAFDSVTVPLEARYPDSREFVHRDLIAAAREEIEKAVGAVGKRAAEARLTALESRMAADKANGGDVELAKTARRLERHAYVLTAEADLESAQQKLAEALQATKPDGEVDEKKIGAAKRELDKAVAALGKKPETYSPIGEQYPEKSTGRRTALARWIASTENPLTARVAVNHIWARHFGRGLVESVHDFGQYGKPPTHPELLDYLATQLVANGWRMKPIHRLMVTSDAYRMASARSEKADPDNVYLWRMNARRMEAEAVRDSVLHAAGQLDTTRGGPEVEETKELDTMRRSIYIRQAPDVRSEFLSQFDSANPNECYRREESIVPQQALSLANSRLTLEQARRLAAKLPEEGFVGAAFEAVLNRPPSASERDDAATFLVEQTRLLSEPGKLKPFETGVAAPLKPSSDPSQRARENLVHVLFNLNEFVTIR
ncbi:MAG: DUF1553 domain-containing protein [Bryobacteraceae bacterium]